VSTDATDETDAEQAEARRRRTIIRLLVGFGIGIPILVELATFVGLLEQSLLGGEDGDDEAGTATATERTTTTTADRGAGVGDELLAETPQRETLSNASFRAGDDQWVLTLVARVENTESYPYTVQFGAVTTENGRRVEGSGRSVTVAAGETTQVTGTWQLPPGSRPAAVTVRTAAGETAATTHDVTLAPIPVEGN
jgi:hypothetical protein